MRHLQYFVWHINLKAGWISKLEIWCASNDQYAPGLNPHQLRTATSFRILFFTEGLIFYHLKYWGVHCFAHPVHLYFWIQFPYCVLSYHVSDNFAEKDIRWVKWERMFTHEDNRIEDMGLHVSNWVRICRHLLEKKTHCMMCLCTSRWNILFTPCVIIDWSLRGETWCMQQISTLVFFMWATLCSKRRWFVHRWNVFILFLDLSTHSWNWQSLARHWHLLHSFPELRNQWYE